ncbi:MAG: SOS response-associated peptidase [Opitutaceae bacterium]|nr:SOS response-associated peptidase [Opitutaceae bacterium]
MCGRYTLKTHRKKIQERMGVDELPDLVPRYNLGPTQDGLVVRTGDSPGTRTAAMLRWGLIPAWTKDKASLPLLINARAETVASKGAFRDSFKRRRCLVVADGFYEWSRRGALRQPFHFTVDHGEPFAMAGLWDSWHPPGASPGETLDTFAIVTTTANEILAPHHDRMPVILEPNLYDDWLNPLLTDTGALERVLVPFPAIRMLARAVSARVNSIKFDDAACLEPPESEATARARPPRPATSGDQLDLGLG